MTQYAFSTGQMWGRPNSGNNTPVQFGVLQNVSVSFQFTQKDLYGRKVFPIYSARGQARVQGTAKFASINARLFSGIVFGSDMTSGPATGSTRVAVEEPQTVVGGNVTVTHNAAGISDLGVIRAENRDIYERVLMTPVGRQYACNETTGVYSFDVDSENRPLLFSYSYVDSSNGRQVSFTNQDQKASHTFSLVLTESFNGKSLTVVLNRCTTTKFSLPNRLEDFMLPELSFQAVADANGVIGSISIDEDRETWIVSAPYPLAYTETFAPTVRMPSGRLNVPTPEVFAPAAVFTGGSLASILRSYTNGVVETFNSSVRFTDGNMPTVYRLYSNGIVETFNSSVRFTDGALVRGLQTYNTGVVETFNSSVRFSGGTLL